VTPDRSRNDLGGDQPGCEWDGVDRDAKQDGQDRASLPSAVGPGAPSLLCRHLPAFNDRLPHRVWWAALPSSSTEIGTT
jgi:hypothetical protein